MLKTRKRRIFAVLLIVAIALTLYFVVGIVRSLRLESTPIQLAIRSPSGIAGTVRMAQLSDLHLAVYGENNRQLVDLVAEKRPDIIITTGDMLDVRAETYDAIVDLYRRLTEIAPVIFSLGNHEMEREDLHAFLLALEREGVRVVNNSAVTVQVNGQTLRIGGLYKAEHLGWLEQYGRVDVLLCHFPHKLDVFAAYGVPLTFSGHTHGGQFRIPFFDLALYAPGQGWFPRYTKGLYEEEGSYMIVSRGLGNSSFPFRVFNPPEVVIADVTYANEIRPID